MIQHFNKKFKARHWAMDAPCGRDCEVGLVWHEIRDRAWLKGDQVLVNQGHGKVVM